MFSRRPISSFNKTPPAANKGPNTSSEQAHPIGSYYEAIIVDPQPIPKTKPEDPPTSSPKSPRSTVKKTAAAPDDFSSGRKIDTAAMSAPSLSAEPATAQEKARIIFGSRLQGPFERAERLKAIKDNSKMVAGILVPPKPEEPDNCCMSGCVNCVWDRFRDEMEEWAFASTRAEQLLQAQEAQGDSNVHSDARPAKELEGLKGQATVGSNVGGVGAVVSNTMSMDDDGGGSETNWPVERPKIAKDFWDDELYKDVPVGIREFMKTEKKLKERHNKNGTVGG